MFVYVSGDGAIYDGDDKLYSSAKPCRAPRHSSAAGLARTKAGSSAQKKKKKNRIANTAHLTIYTVNVIYRVGDKRAFLTRAFARNWSFYRFGRGRPRREILEMRFSDHLSFTYCYWFHNIFITELAVLWIWRISHFFSRSILRTFCRLKFFSKPNTRNFIEHYFAFFTDSII